MLLTEGVDAVIITSMLKSQLTVHYSLGDGLKTSCRMVSPGGAAVAGRWAVFLLHSRLHPVLLWLMLGRPDDCIRPLLCKQEAQS